MHLMTLSLQFLHIKSGNSFKRTANFQMHSYNIGLRPIIIAPDRRSPLYDFIQGLLKFSYS